MRIARAPQRENLRGYYGLITQGFPQLVRVNPGVLAPDRTTDWPSDTPVLCQVRMVNQRPMIPDLEMLEKMIATELEGA